MEGRYYKEYYGMGSARARKKRFAQDRYSQPSKAINEGVEGWVPYRGPVADIIHEYVGGLKAAMGYIGASNIQQMWEKVSSRARHRARLPGNRASRRDDARPKPAPLILY